MTDSDQERELLEVTLDIWHPECWGIASTDEVGSGLVGHGAAVDGRSGYERCTIYGDSREHVEQAIDVAYESPFIRTIRQVEDAVPHYGRQSLIGRTAQDVFIEYDATEGMGAAFLSQGFVLNSSYRIENGLETWELLVYTTRSSFERTLDDIRKERDADITLTRLSPASSPSPVTSRHRQQELTPRQREALTVARKRGYYEWPRAVSVQDLATELDVSKATFLEHLRNAEAKLLGDGH
ncbi:helix-turn-helix domain-containing protein [Natrinema salaciae]|uniref:Predicted DNA binding protein, contains HTH domain n=1 Tax=Natrinema salaciae TaxID=1186196 RepID=A0A1H9P188_9EURY|nr:helix-turn-helix domain-containing protein [Natrinema salaciae]SER41579.1 Predicted DNA binding protein, contains HTH domain [Natrinema salaciae]